MVPQSINSIQSPPAQQSANGSDNILGKESFMKLLVAQLRNQNPLEPMKDQEFVAQMAQFSSLEQLQNLNDIMQENSQWNILLSQTINNTMATSLIGKTVYAESNSLVIGEGKIPEISFTTDTFTDSGTITIYNQSGEIIRTFAVSNLPTGNNSIDWDGKDSDGNKLEAGNYTFGLNLRDLQGDHVNVTSYTSGEVTGVKYIDGQAFLLVDGAYIPLSQVREVSSGDGNG